MTNENKEKKDYKSCLCMYSTCEDCGSRINIINFGKKVRKETIEEVMKIVDKGCGSRMIEETISGYKCGYYGKETLCDRCIKLKQKIQELGDKQ